MIVGYRLGEQCQRSLAHSAYCLSAEQLSGHHIGKASIACICRTRIRHSVALVISHLYRKTAW